MPIKKSLFFFTVFSLLLIIIIPFLLPNGGVGGDFANYVKIASELPHLKDNLFPIGFPFFLRLFEQLTGEYFYSSTILKVACFLFIIIFSYKKNFYFIETVLLMSIKSTLWIFIHQSSEYAGLPFLYLYIYNLHQFFINEKLKNQIILRCTILGIILCTIRYANVFIFISTIPFLIFYFKKLENKRQILFRTTFLIGIGFVSYLMINYLLVESFTGENRRVNDELETFWKDTYVDFIGVINLSNPFFYLKTFEYTSIVKFIISLLFIFIDLFCWFLCYKIIKRNKDIFIHFLIFIAISNALFTFLAAMLQGIEPLGIRLLFSSSYLFWFALLIIIRQEKLVSDKIIIPICFISLIINSLIIVKNPTNFIAYKSKVEKLLDKRDITPIYYYDDGKDTVKSTYHIPLINKSFEYIHFNRQPDFIYKSVLGITNPSIKVLEEEPTTINDSILYSSEISDFIKTNNPTN